MGVIAAAVLATAGLVGFVVVALGEDAVEPVEVTMTEYAFSPSAIHVATDQELHIVNDGEIAHSFYVPDLGKGVELQPGEEATVELPAGTDGSHRVICDLVGHVEAGMVATLEIT
jgi:plastocyanin